MNCVVRKRDAASSIRFWAAIALDGDRVMHVWAHEDRAAVFSTASDANMVARAAQHHGYGACEVVPYTPTSPSHFTGSAS